MSIEKPTPFEIAESMLGLQEVRDKRKLMNFFKANAIKGDIAIDPSVTAWCSAFVNGCNRAGGSTGTGSLMARSWLRWGEPISAAGAKKGDIVIFKRAGSPVLGHVAYFISWDEINGLVKVLGGNQANQVNYTNYLRDHVLGIRRG